MESKEAKQKPEKKEDLFSNFLFNLIIPILLLRFGDEWLGLSPNLILIIALAFPLGYGLKDFAQSRKINIFSVLGLVNILLTGVIGVLKLEPFWLAVKEAAIPAVLGLFVIGSMWTKWPLVKTLLYNRKVMHVDLVEERLNENNKKADFEKTLRLTTWCLGASFFVSSVLNFVLARVLVKTHPEVDMAQYNEELGAMLTWSWVVIVIPSMAVSITAVVILIRGIKSNTGLMLEQIMVGMESDEEDDDEDYEEDETEEEARKE